MKRYGLSVGACYVPILSVMDNQLHLYYTLFAELLNIVHYLALCDWHICLYI